VRATSGYTGKTLGVTWTDEGTGYGGASYDVWEVSIPLSVLASLGFSDTDFSFLYAPGSCGNSVLTGEVSVVPLPSPWLEMATSFLVLNKLRRGKKQSSN